MPGYISEFLHEGGGATDFVEVAVPTGTDTFEPPQQLPILPRGICRNMQF